MNYPQGALGSRPKVLARSLAALGSIVFAALVAAALTLPAPASTHAFDPTFDAAQMTFEAARVQATIKARATADAQSATRVSIQQTAAVVAIQQTQTAVEQTRAAQATRSALEAQATRQALDLTATTQHYQQIANATETAIAIRATQQAFEVEATAGAVAARATRQALDEQATQEQRERTEATLRLAGIAVALFCAAALSFAVGVWAWKAKREHVAASGPGPQQDQARQTVVEAPPLDEQAAPPVVVTVPQTRIIYGDAADEGALAIARLLEMQGEYNDEPSSSHACPADSAGDATDAPRA